MNTIHDMIKNEDPVDVILSLTRKNGISHPQLDRLYSYNNWPFIGNNMALIILVKKMISEGLIASSGKGYVKGPNWREPPFVTENKYTFAPQ